MVFKTVQATTLKKKTRINVLYANLRGPPLNKQNVDGFQAGFKCFPLKIYKNQCFMGISRDSSLKYTIIDGFLGGPK